LSGVHWFWPTSCILGADLFRLWGSQWNEHFRLVDCISQKLMPKFGTKNSVASLKKMTCFSLSKTYVSPLAKQIFNAPS
jgi:hypothetical protein